MSSRMTRMAFILVALVGLAVTPIRAQEPGSLPPSEVLHRMLENMADNPGKQPDTTRPLIPLAKTTGLSREEQFALGEAYFLAFLPKESTAVFNAYLKDDDNLARVAWQRHMQMVFRAFDRHDEAEALLPEFRKKFPPVAEDTFYGYQAVDNQARRHRDAGNHAKVVQLILDEVNPLPTDVPFSSFLLLITYLPSFEAVGQRDVALAKIDSVVAGLKAMLLKNKQPLPTGTRPPQVPRERHPHKPGLIHNVTGYNLADDAPDFDPQRLRFRLSTGFLGRLQFSLSTARGTPGT